MANGQSKRENRPPAPDFPAHAEWINTERPLSMEDLRGRVALLDFWTYACINCMHILPDLAKLERRYGDRLVIVGVHSAKYTGERETENIRNAVKRYGIHHPVVNDAGMILWQRLGVNAWPTLVLIDQQGRIVGRVSGEGNYPILDRAISDLLEERPVHPEDLPPLPLTDEVRAEPDTLLRFPGKVLADPEGQRLFIADSGHNRIVAADLTGGDILYTIGSGEEALRDGGFEDAGFSNPQGMTLAGDILYIADTDNHALRAADLVSRTVRTAAGTGHQAPYGSRGGMAETTPLNSPWDVTWLNDKVYIAMAGSHQIWEYDPKSGMVNVYAGSGREDIVDGSLGTAALAQPSGITTDGGDLFFADSETSSIRKISGGQVTTLAGKGLFEFGHRDGTFRNAYLQHPLGVVWDNGMLWVADTYNNRLRRMDLAHSVIDTAAGTERDGLADGLAAESRFDEPGGVSVAGGRVYVADTNNHSIRIYDPLPRVVTTYALVEATGFPAGGGTLQVRIFPPRGYHINVDSPSFLDAVFLKEEHKLESTVVIRPDEIRISFPITSDRVGYSLTLSGDIYLCREGERGLCVLETVQFTRKLRPDPELTGSGVIIYNVPKPRVEPVSPVLT